MAHYLEFEKPIAELEGKIEELKRLTADGTLNIADEVAKLQARSTGRSARSTASSRHAEGAGGTPPERPHCSDYLAGLIEEFTPLAGDRLFADDKAIIGGIGRLRGQSVVVMGHEKGSDTESRIKHNSAWRGPRATAGAAPVRTGRPLQAAGRRTRRHRRRLSGHRCRSARPGRGDRQDDRGFASRACAVRRGHRGRRRLRRGHRHRVGQQGG